MAKNYNIHATGAEFWRSDNPLIATWFRFGDDPTIKNQVRFTRRGEELAATGADDEALLVDSSLYAHQLVVPRNVGGLNAVATSTSGIAPNQGGSGMIFVGANSASRRGFGLDYNKQFASTYGGPYGGLFAGYSGITVMGWIQFAEDLSASASNSKSIFGFGDYSSFAGQRHAWNLDWNQPLGRIRGLWRSASTSHLVNSTPVNPLPLNEPVFFALQMGHVDDAAYTGGGAGRFLRLYTATHVSGLTLAEEITFDDADGRADDVPLSDTDENYCIGNDCKSMNTLSTFSNFLPQGTIIDNYVVVLDGNLSSSSVEYFMNNGIQHIDFANPYESGLVPELPGTDDLVAYWTFDDGTGTNSSPNTSGIFDLDLQFNRSDVISYDAVPGIRGGSGVLLPGSLTNGGRYSPGVFDVGNVNEAFMYIPAGSGYPHLFPTNDKRGMTVIGWMADQPTTIASSTDTRCGAIFGWDADNLNSGGRSPNLMGAGFQVLNDTSPTVARSSMACRGYISGLPATSLSISNNIVQVEQPNADAGSYYSIQPTQWNLFAIVIDFEDGQIWGSVNAGVPRLISQRFSPVSGLDAEIFINGLSDWVNDMGFVLGKYTNTNNTTDNDMYYDDVAVYDRPLTLPEISGFALSGIVTPAPNVFPTQSTDDPRTLGSWKLDGSGTFTNPVTSGEDAFFEDDSHYIHKVTVLSGMWSQTTALVPFAADNSLRIDVSGSMASLPRDFFGSNLDFSEPGHFNHKGFSAGILFKTPSSLEGRHHLIGCWNQDAGLRSWQLGVEDNRLFATVVDPNVGEQEVVSLSDITIGATVFAGISIIPSGSVYVMQLVEGTGEITEGDISIVGYDSKVALDVLPQCGASGFSILNVPNMQQGFPSGTQIQSAFIYSSGLPLSDMDANRRFGMEVVSITADASTVADADNISHWKFDRTGAQFTDFGVLRNPMIPITTDSSALLTEPAIHASGVRIKEQSYITTLPNNPNTRGLTLGSGSFTILGWLQPNGESGSDDEFYAATTADPNVAEGMQMLSRGNETTLEGRVADIITSGHNSMNYDRSSWHHFALVHDKDQLIQNVVIDGRYAGLAVSDDIAIAMSASLSGLTLGGRGSDTSDPFAGSAGFSGILDDWMVFDRALTVSEISGLAANSFNYNPGTTEVVSAAFGTYISGLLVNELSGIIGGFIRGLGQEFELSAGYISGVDGAFGHAGGYIRGKVIMSGLLGGFTHGLGIMSGVFGGMIHGLGVESGVVGVYEYGACQTFNEFDVTFVFNVVAAEDFDARLAVELTDFSDFDARLGVIRITQPPICSLIYPEIQTVASGLPAIITASGLVIGQNQKDIELVRFTFSDFRGAELGVLESGVSNNGIYSAQRALDTQGLYTIKIEAIDEYGYRSSCAQQVLVIGSGSTSGSVLSALPQVEFTAIPTSGSTKQLVVFTHSLSGLSNTSGILEYTDFADQQESLVNGLEMPSGTAFGRAWTLNAREHIYTMPGYFLPVWSLSGSWGIVSETLSDGIDTVNF